MEISFISVSSRRMILLLRVLNIFSPYPCFKHNCCSIFILFIHINLIIIALLSQSLVLHTGKTLIDYGQTNEKIFIVFGVIFFMILSELCTCLVFYNISNNFIFYSGFCDLLLNPVDGHQKPKEFTTSSFVFHFKNQIEGNTTKNQLDTKIKNNLDISFNDIFCCETNEKYSDTYIKSHLCDIHLCKLHAIHYQYFNYLAIHSYSHK